MKAKWFNVFLIVVMLVIGSVPSVSADGSGPLIPTGEVPSAENGK